jgi:hypothetical protein
LVETSLGGNRSALDEVPTWTPNRSRGAEKKDGHPLLQTARGSALMAFRTNYRLERAERDRIKKAKKDEKLKRQQERATLHPAPDSPENPDKPTPSEE